MREVTKARKRTLAAVPRRGGLAVASQVSLPRIVEGNQGITSALDAVERPSRGSRNAHEFASQSQAQIEPLSKILTRQSLVQSGEVEVAAPT